MTVAKKVSLARNPDLKPGEFIQIIDQETGDKTIEAGNCVRFGLIELGVIGEIKLFANISIEMDNLNEYLKADAARALGPGVRFDIREKLPENYGASYGRAWYHHPRMTAEAEWPEGVVDGGKKYVPEGGYYLVGKFVTPDDAARTVDRSLDRGTLMPQRPIL